MALKLANYVVTESGFAADLGLEKLFDIVCPEGDLKPSVAVLVVSVKAVKSHTPGSAVGKKLLEFFKEGFENIDRHVQNIKKFGVPVVVAINRFPDDTDDAIRTLQDFLRSIGVENAVSEGVRLGGRGALELAEKVLRILNEQPSHFRPFYERGLSSEEKIEKLAVGLYGASGVVFLDEAKKDLELIHALRLDGLPVNIAKTPYSFSDDPRLKGAPTGWRLKVRGVRPYTGAGFLVVLCGKLMLMPGLPVRPMLEDMDLSDDGEARGLF